MRVSECCGAARSGGVLESKNLCPECLEHCDFVENGLQNFTAQYHFKGKFYCTVVEAESRLEAARKFRRLNKDVKLIGIFEGDA